MRRIDAALSRAPNGPDREKSARRIAAARTTELPRKTAKMPVFIALKLSGWGILRAPKVQARACDNFQTSFTAGRSSLVSFGQSRAKLVRGARPAAWIGQGLTVRQHHRHILSAAITQRMDGDGNLVARFHGIGGARCACCAGGPFRSTTPALPAVASWTTDNPAVRIGPFNSRTVPFIVTLSRSRTWRRVMGESGRGKGGSCDYAEGRTFMFIISLNGGLALRRRTSAIQRWAATGCFGITASMPACAHSSCFCAPPTPMAPATWPSMMMGSAPALGKSLIQTEA